VRREYKFWWLIIEQEEEKKERKYKASTITIRCLSATTQTQLVIPISTLLEANMLVSDVDRMFRDVDILSEVCIVRRSRVAPL